MTRIENKTWAQIARKAAEGSPLSPRDVFVVIQRLAAVGYGVVPVRADPTKSGHEVTPDDSGYSYMD